MKKHAPDSIIVMVTNPLDVMAHVALKVTGFEPRRVVGMAGVLDSARFEAFIAQELGVSISRVNAMVMGAPRRHDGTAAALHVGERDPVAGADGRGHDPAPRGLHAERGRGGSWRS